MTSLSSMLVASPPLVSPSIVAPAFRLGSPLASWLASPLTMQQLFDQGAQQGLKGHDIPWTIVISLTLLTLLPAVMLSMTPMVRLLIVFHFLRQALGTQTAPSNQTLMGLGLMMTWFLMQPVLVAVN